MKKFFLIGLAATAMLTSCSNDETVEMAQSKAIGFCDVFVNNGTRSIVDPSFTKTNLRDFAVYGFTQNGKIFDGVKVNAQTGYYSPQQYWVADNTYTFGAVAPYSVATNVSGVALADGKIGMTVAFTNDGTVDLLHAAPASINCNETFIANPTKVGMTFAHQLSKVKFSFENAVGEGYNVKVTDVKITNAKGTGTLTIGATNAWSAQNGSVELAFGNVTAADATSDVAAAITNNTTLESYKEMLMIPTDNTAEYTVTFSAELLSGGVSMRTFNHTTTIKGVELKLGFCYDFKATLTHANIVDPENPLKPIEFEVVDVNDWNRTDIDQTLEVSTTQSGN